MIYLVLVPIYFVICVSALVTAIYLHKAIKKAGRNPWISTILITVMTFFIVTWDWLPSEIYYAYQCSQLPPMQVYKTPEQWLAENQDLINGEEVKFKINSEEDLPQVSEEGYLLKGTGYTQEKDVFIRVIYQENSFLRTSHIKEVLIDRRTGFLLVSNILFDQVIRFYSPPETAGGKSCGFKNKNASILDFLDIKVVKDFYQLQRDIKN